MTLERPHNITYMGYHCYHVNSRVKSVTKVKTVNKYNHEHHD